MNLETEILSRAQGISQSLFWQPTSGHCRDLLSWERWRLAYWQTGVSVSTGGGDAAYLRELVCDGYCVATGGKTKASAHRLTWKGMLVSLPGDGVDGADLLSFLQKLVDAGGGLMGWQLCPAAVGWVRLGNDPAAYLHELDQIQDYVFPLEIVGYVKTTVSVGVPFWGVSITDAGRDALRNPPELHETGTHFDFESWAEGWRIGKDRFSGKPPAEYDRVIPYACTAEIWSGMPKRVKS